MNDERPVSAHLSESNVKQPRRSARLELLATWNALEGDAYELDHVERWLEKGQKPECDRATMIRYSGTMLRYHGALFVHPAFKPRLERFEALVAEVSREVYGRAPMKIRHYGAFNCRSTRRRSWVVSEHALGNALDLVGFDFGPATKEAPLPAELSRSLRQPFQVRIARHFNAEHGVGATHARFLRLLTDRLRERKDIFRSMFGPAHGGHDDHLHLDAAPYRYIDL